MKMIERNDALIVVCDPRRMELKTMTKEFAVLSLDKRAQAALADVTSYGVEAGDLSSETGKRMRQTEISLRKLSSRLETIRETLDVDDRPALAEAIHKIETARNDLLSRMFRK